MNCGLDRRSAQWRPKEQQVISRPCVVDCTPSTPACHCDGDKRNEGNDEKIAGKRLFGYYARYVTTDFVFMLCGEVIGIHAALDMGVRMGLVVIVLAVGQMEMHGKRLDTDHHQQNADDQTLASVSM
jgi:hypothetical protein